MRGCGSSVLSDSGSLGTAGSAGPVQDPGRLELSLIPLDGFPLDGQPEALGSALLDAMKKR
jgi:hypothetical protein